MPIRHSLALLMGAALVASAATIGFGQESTPAASSIRIDNAQVRLIHTIEVAAQADGLINEIYVDEGNTVTGKQQVIKIDSRVAEADVAVAKTELEAATKQAAQTADLEFAKASNEVAIASLGEMKNLYAKNAVARVQVRQAELEATKTKLGVDVALVKESQDEMSVLVANEKYKAAQVRLELYTMLAPMEGLITERMRDRGEWVRAGEPVFKMVHMNELKVEAMVPIYDKRSESTGSSQFSPKVHVDGAVISAAELKNMPMKITINVSPRFNYEYETVVQYVSPEIRVDEVMVWAKIPNQRVSPAGPWLLRDGMVANVEIRMQ